jgi:hypothetical protein
MDPQDMDDLALQEELARERRLVQGTELALAASRARIAELDQERLRRGGKAAA